ncbi:response regulator [Methanolobus sp. ZRKC3]|uniref:response regulator n=1 Tax=Methanolobus sp. ZRKC3 TaxID=3125786 RepID=UPI003245D8A7
MSKSSRPRILVVDDEPLNVELLEAYLSPDCDIIPAYGGLEALELASKEKLDLILLDVMMPDMNGYQVCEKIKSSSFSQFVPVILVTALSGRGDRLKGIKSHADDFLTKPVDRLELSMRVKSLLRIKSLHDNVVFERDQAQNYLDVAGVMMLVLNTDHKLTLVNKRTTEILGYSETDILGKDWFDYFVPENTRNSCEANFEKIRNGSTEDIVHYEGPILCKGGAQKIISWYSKILTDGNGDRVGILCSGEDITQRKESEIKLKEYASNLQSSNELKDLFMDIMSHDLLNPAGVAKGFIDMLLCAEEDKGKISKLEFVDASVTRLIDMIELAASFGKLEDIDYLEFEKMNLSDVLSEVAATFETQLASKNICLDMNLDGSYAAKMNPLISGVFVNYISNAIKYGPSDSSIIIDIDDLSDEWKVKVTDFGDGVPDGNKDLVFDRFKRLTQNKKVVKGTGLGLAIVKRIVELHGGRVGVDDNPHGMGSVFWATLKKA